jgi:hypothetical protein
MILRLASASLLLVLQQAAAPPGRPAPPELLDQLVANAAVYGATLPSLTADETIQSEASYRGLFKDKVEAKGTFRAIRGAPGEQLSESRQLITVNGKPVDPSKPPKLPFTLFGGFGRFQEMFFTPQHIHCFAFAQLSDPGPGGAIQLAISVPAELEHKPGCVDSLHGLTGLARVDPVSHQLTHLERTIPDNGSDGHLAPFASVDCAPTKVGDETFWLPTVVIGGAPKHAIRAEFVAHYNNYHRYTASVTLLPGATEVDPATATPEPPKPPVSTPP